MVWPRDEGCMSLREGMTCSVPAGWQEKAEHHNWAHLREEHHAWQTSMWGSHTPEMAVRGERKLLATASFSARLAQ